MEAYKSADNCIIKLIIPNEACTNITRSNIKDRNYAMYRTDSAHVVDIYDKDDRSIKLNHIRSDYDHNFIYIKGQSIKEPGFNTYLEKTSTHGIHFFLTELPAYQRNKTIHDGKKFQWYSDGQMNYVENYVDGKLSGEKTQWYENGQINYVENYIDGRLNGDRIQWYQNGIIETEECYEDDSLLQIKTFYQNGNPCSHEIHDNGKYYTYYENGSIKSEGIHILSESGEFDQFDVYKEWYDDKSQKCIAYYKDGNLHGNKKEWYPNKQLACDENYKDGLLDGRRLIYHEDGSIYIDTEYIEGSDINKEIISYIDQYYNKYLLEKKERKKASICI